MEMLDERSTALMHNWRTLLATAGLTGGMLAGGLLAAVPADAQPYPYYRHDPRAIEHRRVEEHRIAERRRFRERERFAEDRQFVQPHWEYRNGRRFWREGYWR
jgi:hypothetical protein